MVDLSCSARKIMGNEAMNQADQAPPAASTTPGDEKYQKLQALGKALLDEERLRLLGLLT